MAKGAAFEERALGYLKGLFEQLGFPVTEARRQSAGTQNGFDIRIGFLDDNRRERKFYFECKDYTSVISWNDIGVKILELHASSHRPDGYIALSPHVDFSNINLNLLEKLAHTVQAPILYWTPETQVKEYFSLDASFCQFLYGITSPLDEAGRNALLETIRAVITGMLHQRDEWVAKGKAAGLPKELTLKIPRVQPDDIIGRAADLEELHQLLFNNQRVVVVNGLGGIGKTTLAQAYLGKYYNEYHHIVWITQLSEDIINDIVELVKMVDYHTLTIEILARTAQLRRLDAEVLKDAIKEDLRANVYVNHKGERVDKVFSYLSSIFSLSDLSADEIWLMKQFVCLPAEYHAYELLLTLIDPDESKKEVFAETLNGLVEKGWLLCNPVTDAYKIHIIVQEVAGKQLVPELDDINKLMEAITRNLLVDQTKDNPVEKFIWIPYGQVLLHQFQGKILSEITSLQNNLAAVLRYYGDFTGASILLEKALQATEQLFGPEHPSISVRLSNLGLVLKELGDYSGARAAIEKAMYLDESNFGPDHPNTARRYSNLAVGLQAQGDYTGAKSLLEKAVYFDERNLGPDHPTTAVRYSNLGLVLRALGDYIGAKTLLEKVMRLSEQQFGQTHPNTATSYTNLGTTLQALGDYSGARVLLEKALNLDKQNFGPDHPDTAASYSNLGLVLKEMGDYAGAQAFLEQAMLLNERHLGSTHPLTAIRYSNLGQVLQDLGNYAEAQVLLEKALYAAELNFGPDHPTTAVRYSNLAILYSDLGNYNSARTLLEKALLLNEKYFGIDHPQTGVSYSNLATVLVRLDDYHGALDSSTKSVAILEKVLPEGHPHIGKAAEIYYFIKAKL